MVDKYYIPRIDELFVGYGYEEYRGWGSATKGFEPGTEGEKPEYWKPNKIEEDYLYCGGECGNEMQDLLRNLEDNRIRTKYLTKEDIESLGWVYKGKGVDLWFEKEGEFQQSSWTSYKAILQYGLHDKRMVITLEDPGYNPTIFNGTVPSINELKYLSKLLFTIHKP